MSWLCPLNKVPDDSNMLTLQRKTVKNFIKPLRYPATKIRGSIKLTQAFCWCSFQHGGGSSGVSHHDNTAIYHGDGTKYWLSVTGTEEWD